MKKDKKKSVFPRKKIILLSCTIFFFFYSFLILLSFCFFFLNYFIQKKKVILLRERSTLVWWILILKIYLSDEVMRPKFDRRFWILLCCYTTSLCKYLTVYVYLIYNKKKMYESFCAFFISVVQIIKKRLHLCCCVFSAAFFLLGKCVAYKI